MLKSIEDINWRALSQAIKKGSFFNTRNVSLYEELRIYAHSMAASLIVG